MIIKKEDYQYLQNCNKDIFHHFFIEIPIDFTTPKELLQQPEVNVIKNQNHIEMFRILYMEQFGEEYIIDQIRELIDESEFDC